MDDDEHMIRDLLDAWWRGTETNDVDAVGNWAWMRTHISVTMTPAGGQPNHRAGYTLTILRKEPDGRWVVGRDANLLSA